MRAAIPSDKPGGLEAKVSPHFGRCDVFTLVEIENKKVKKVEIKENEGAHFGLGPTPAQILASMGVDAIVVRGIGPKALSLLEQSAIRVYMTSAPTVREAVQELIEGRAKLASSEDACAHPDERSQVLAARMPWGGGPGMGPPSYGPPYPPAPYPPQPIPKPSPPPGRFKVAVASQGQGGLDDVVSPIFGRCPAFTVVEVEGKEIKGVKVLPNQFISAPRGVGIAVVQMLANEGVRYIVAGRFGPWASTASGQFGIQLVMVPPGIRVRDAINQYIIGAR